MANRIILVKKSPSQVGYGILTRVDYTGGYNADAQEARAQELAVKARDSWSLLNPDWKFRIVNPRDYSMDQKYYDDDDPAFKTITRGIYHAEA